MADWIDFSLQEEVPDPKNLDEDYRSDSCYEDSVNDVQAQPEEGDNQLGKDLMTKFFHKFDEDDSGLLDVEEILAGVEKFAEAMDLDFDSRRIAKLFEELDEDGNQELDREEFTVFLEKYAEFQDIGMEDLAYTMATMNEQETSAVISSKQAPKARPNSFFFRSVFSAVVFQGQQKASAAATMPVAHPTSSENSNNSSGRGLSGFFRRISFNPQPPKDPTPPPPVEKKSEDAGDDLTNMMWDVDAAPPPIVQDPNNEYEAEE